MADELAESEGRDFVSNTTLASSGLEANLAHHRLAKVEPVLAIALTRINLTPIPKDENSAESLVVKEILASEAALAAGEQEFSLSENSARLLAEIFEKKGGVDAKWIGAAFKRVAHLASGVQDPTTRAELSGAIADASDKLVAQIKANRAKIAQSANPTDGSLDVIVRTNIKLLEDLNILKSAQERLREIEEKETSQQAIQQA